jgi:hypothetical protein
VNLVTREAIYSTGGWLELGYDWTKRLHTYAGFGVDDPWNEDVPLLGRTYNQFAFVNGILDVTEKMRLGLEVQSWKTNWSGLNPADAVRFEFTGEYAF